MVVDFDVDTGVVVVVVVALVGVEFCFVEESRVRLDDRFRFFMAPIQPTSTLPLYG